MSENASPASRVIEPGSTVLVTGASSGIGLETAVGAARAGFRVLATVRDLARTDALTSAASGLDVEVRRLNVTDLKLPVEAYDPDKNLKQQSGRIIGDSIYGE